MTLEAKSTPQLEDVLLAAIEARLVDLHTHLPAEVVEYDKATQTATVRPCIKRKRADGTVVDLPVIQMVPVWHPRVGKAQIHLPVKPGAVGQLHFSERSLEIWLEKGGCVDPLDPRKHALSDAVFYPGAYPLTDSGVVGDEDAIELRNGDGSVVELRIRADGKVSIKADELLLGDHTLAEFVAVASKVESRLATLETFANSHLHPVTTAPGATGTATPPGVFTGPAVASSKVKVST